MRHSGCIRVRIGQGPVAYQNNRSRSLGLLRVLLALCSVIVFLALPYRQVGAYPVAERTRGSHRKPYLTPHGQFSEYRRIEDKNAAAVIRELANRYGLNSVTKKQLNKMSKRGVYVPNDLRTDAEVPWIRSLFLAKLGTNTAFGVVREEKDTIGAATIGDTMAAARGRVQAATNTGSPNAAAENFIAKQVREGFTREEAAYIETTKTIEMNALGADGNIKSASLDSDYQRVLKRERSDEQLGIVRVLDPQTAVFSLRLPKVEGVGESAIHSWLKGGEMPAAFEALTRGRSLEPSQPGREGAGRSYSVTEYSAAGNLIAVIDGMTKSGDLRTLFKRSYDQHGMSLHGDFFGATASLVPEQRQQNAHKVEVADAASEEYFTVEVTLHSLCIFAQCGLGPVKRQKLSGTPPGLQARQPWMKERQIENGSEKNEKKLTDEFNLSEFNLSNAVSRASEVTLNTISVMEANGENGTLRLKRRSALHQRNGDPGRAIYSDKGYMLIPGSFVDNGVGAFDAHHEMNPEEVRVDWIVEGDGASDPAQDPLAWARVSASGPVQIVTGEAVGKDHPTVWRKWKEGLPAKTDLGKEAERHWIRMQVGDVGVQPRAIEPSVITPALNKIMTGHENTKGKLDTTAIAEGSQDSNIYIRSDRGKQPDYFGTTGDTGSSREDYIKKVSQPSGAQKSPTADESAEYREKELNPVLEEMIKELRSPRVSYKGIAANKRQPRHPWQLDYAAWRKVLSAE